MVYAEEIMKQFEKEARDNKRKGLFSHFFIYFSGHGVVSGDYLETCGVDGRGELIPWDYYG
jgi:hypothetical protein